MENLDVATPMPAMADPITVMLGPVGPLLRKLHGWSRVPDLLTADEIRLLEELWNSLKGMSEDADASFMARRWTKMVRELCYDTDDLLEEVIDGARAQEDFSELVDVANDDFLGLIARAKAASGNPNLSQWLHPNKDAKDADSGEAGVIFGRSTVGAVEIPAKLVELLALDEDDKTLKVIPINGFAGVGKTTVARTLYHRHGGKFECRAFVTVSRNPNTRGFLTSMLSQLKAPRPTDFPDVPKLINAINKHLQGKRYFIVIDDLWTASIWHIISHAFPRGDYCSRIITTTQIDDVALACCGYYPVFIYKMEPLNDYKSLELFFGIKEVSNTLKEKFKHKEYSEQMKDVLDLIYSGLPTRLRTCLLYLSMYQQGYAIKKDELVNHWVAEGFLSAVGGRDIEEIAEDYFDELVSKGMVQAVDTDNDGKVLSCLVHQIVLDFVRHKSREENFVITLDYLQSTLALPDKVRRLSVQFGGVKSAYIPESIVTSHVRSLIFWGFFKCLPSSIMDYGLLRILILYIWADEPNESLDLTGIRELFLLKYLEVECNIPVKLPDTDEIRWLQRLETLKLHAKLVDFPSDIVSPPTPDLPLRKIELSRHCCIFFSLPKWFGELRNLCIIKIAIRRLSMNDTDMLKGLPALTALTLYIQTVPEEKMVIDVGGFHVLTYFKFMCAAPCLFFVPGAMPKVQKLTLCFNANQRRSYTFGKVALSHLTALTEVLVKLGVRHADDVDIKGVESALADTLKHHANTVMLRVQCVDVIVYCEEDKSTTTQEVNKKTNQIEEDKKEITESSEKHVSKLWPVDSRLMESKACTTRSDLEKMLIDETTEPMPLPLSLLQDITRDFSQDQQIGSGGFAIVYKGKLGDRAVAVKRLCGAFMDETVFHREVECLMRVKHKNVLRFLGYCADMQGSIERYNGKFVIKDVHQRLLCFEYIPQGSLDKYITDAYHEWGTCYKIIKGICDGLQYLHENHIIHLDLKPANILLDNNMVPKIADFGLSRCFDENQSRDITKTILGTVGYLAPEIRKGGEIVHKADLYSLGVIIIEILTGQKGYQATEDVLESWSGRLERSQRDTLYEQIRVCYEIALECSDFNPKKRPASARDIMERLQEMESNQVDTMYAPKTTVLPPSLKEWTSRKF